MECLEHGLEPRAQWRLVLLLRASRASEARKSTAAAAPTMPSWFCVPVSSRSGIVSGAGWSFGTSSAPSCSRRPKSTPEVWPVELVGRAGQKVAAPLCDVDELMRGKVDGVNEREHLRLHVPSQPPGRRR